MNAGILLNRLKLKILRRQQPEKKRLALKERTVLANKANYKEVKNAM